MKKWFISLFVLILLFFAAVYIFIPRTLQLSAIAYTHCATGAAYRVLSDESQWTRWWAGNKYTSYRITKKVYNGFEIDIQSGNLNTGSTLHLIPLPADSLALQWQCSLPSGNNPFTKIAWYQKAVALKKNMSAKLQHLGGLLAENENVYGFAIQRTSVTDTLLVATKAILPAYPTTPDIYRLINILNSYIGSQGAKKTGAPIMNVTRLDDHQFQLMVAIPVDKQLPGTAAVSFARMVPGHFMAITVQGGPARVNEAANQLQLYFSDYQRTSMAIPFRALITDRQAEPDTSKWVTRIYQPVY